MNKISKDNNSELPAKTDTSLDSATTTTSSAVPKWVSELPGFALKNIVKAATFLGTTGLYYFDTLSERRTRNTSRHILGVGAANHIVSNFGSGSDLSERALKSEYERLISAQSNVEDIFVAAIEDFSNSTSAGTEANDIDEDWLTNFRRHASQFSSERMQSSFAKILSGEMQRPGSFSARTLQALSTLEQNDADALRLFCSCAHFSTLGDVRVFSLGLDPNNNGLSRFGLSYGTLMTLEEAGLLASTNSYREFEASAFSIIPFRVGPHACLARDLGASTGFQKYPGPVLSNVGAELYKIIDVPKNDEYFSAFAAFMLRGNLEVYILPDGTPVRGLN